MCTPAKRLALGLDALDLSLKPTLDVVRNSEITALSEDDDEKSTLASSDTEKENAPFNENELDVKSLLICLENELCQEEAALTLLQKLHNSQNQAQTKTSSRSASKSVTNSSHSSFSTTNETGMVGHKPGSTPVGATKSTSTAHTLKQFSLPQSISASISPVPSTKISKQAALQSLEHLYATKKAVVRKQLERNLESVSLPRPTPGTGFCEIAFVPSAITTDLTALLGLEEVVTKIQDFDPSNLRKRPESRCTFTPFVCAKCRTDFTPVWKREKPGSANVICEACLTGMQRVSLKKEYEESVEQVIQLHVDALLELEKEYQDTINTPSKLDAYIKEQEKKLTIHTPQQMSSSQRYNKVAVNATASSARQSSVGGTSVAAAAHQRSRVAATVTGDGANSAPSVVAINSSNQAVAQAAAAAQIALQQYAKAMSSQQHAAAAAALLQQQQRLVAAQLLSGLQAQQTVAAQTTSDQLATTLSQIQNILMNTGLISGGCTGANQSPNSHQQLLQQAMQYLLLQQQQQAQQQAAAAAAQQNAAITHFFSQIQNNPAAYINLMQLWQHSGLGGVSGNAGNGAVPGKK